MVGVLYLLLPKSKQKANRRVFCAGKDNGLNKSYHMNKADTNRVERLFPPYSVTERKIGKSTFMVYSWFNVGREKDIVSTVARLIRHDSEKAD